MPTFSFVYERMRAKDATKESLWRIAEPVCEGAGYELVDIAFVQSPHGWILRVLIDHLDGQPVERADGDLESTDRAAPEPGAGEPSQGPPDTSPSSLDSTSTITFADCERVSRELSAVLDVEDPIATAYDLEVSSPGLDRPLRTAEHFTRFAGQRARISLVEGVDGRRNFTGTLVAVTDGDGIRSVVLDVDGTRFELALSDVATARLVPNWDELFKAR